MPRSASCPTPGPDLHPAAGDTTSRLELDGVSLAYRDEGEGLPLLCLHAIGHGAADFRGLRARLRRPVRLLALDWPGHGSSGPDRAPLSATRYAELAAGFLARLGLRRVVLLGNSIGGAAALRVAATDRERVRALVLCNPGGLAPVDALARGFTRAMAAFHAFGARGGRGYGAAFALYYRSVLQRRAAAWRREEIVARARDAAPLLAEAWRSFGAPDADQRALVPEIRQPVLLAWATRDPVISLWLARRAIERFPDARLERFPAGHAPFLETPEAFAASLDRFLHELDRSALDPRGGF